MVLELGPVEEACPLGLAPSSSTTAMLAVGDALALVTSRMRNFGREDFARFHPAGSLGQKLSKVEHHMRPLAQCRVAPEDQTVREVLVRVSVPGRRTGATMLVDARGQAVRASSPTATWRGCSSSAATQSLDGPIRDVMTAQPLHGRASAP